MKFRKDISIPLFRSISLVLAILLAGFLIGCIYVRATSEYWPVIYPQGQCLTGFNWSQFGSEPKTKVSCDSPAAAWIVVNPLGDCDSFIDGNCLDQYYPAGACFPGQATDIRSPNGNITTNNDYSRLSILSCDADYPKDLLVTNTDWDNTTGIDAAIRFRQIFFVISSSSSRDNNTFLCQDDQYTFYSSNYVVCASVFPRTF